MTSLLKHPKLLFFSILFSIISCSDDDDMMPSNPIETLPENPIVVEETKTYDLGSVAVPDISGKVVFKKNSDNSTSIDIELSNTPSGGQHPAHIHVNTAAEGGSIALTLGPVDGNTGKSSITISALDDGSAISYEDLIAFDGYINVHLSADELSTIVAQGDIGQNELTNVSNTYDLNEKAVPGLDGKVTFYERKNGEALSVIELMNTPENGVHPAHIHFNSALEGGGIAISLNPIDGNTGLSKTNINQQDDGSSFLYNDLINFDGYINVHLSVDELSTIVAQGDIGSNELTGISKMYMFGEKDVPGITGMLMLYKRKSNETLAKLSLMNTPEGGVHPAHIHNNSAAQSGGIALSFTPVDGTTGMSYTHIAALNDGTSISYDELLEFDGYVNVHLSAEELATIVVQGDIGENELTGISSSYELNEKDVAGIFGKATFYERKSGEALALLEIMNTPAGGIHPAHIHENDAATGGPIALSFNPVNGDSGISRTHIDKLDNGTLFGYEDILTYDGYINVHLSADNLGTIVAQGNIGSNKGDDTNSSSGEAYSVTNQGASAYIFNGGSLSNESNPNLTLKRGVTYEFDVKAPGHPFYIKNRLSTGTGNTYGEGVGNNGAVDGKVTFTVPSDAPDTLYYICEFHSSMSGTFNIID